MAFRIKNKKLNIIWPISFLKFCLPFFAYCFFSQIFLLLCTIFDCVDGHSFISSSLECQSGVWFSILAPLSEIAIFLHTIIALITNILYFRPIFINKNKDLLNKTNSFPDTIFIITKIGLNLLFYFNKENENEQWTVLFFSILFSGVNAYYNFYYQNKVNKTLTILNNILSLTLVSGFLSLLIGKMLQKIKFTGSIYLFLISIIIIYVNIFFFQNKEIQFISIDYKEINNPVEYLYYISKYYTIIQNKKKSRNNYALLESLINNIEENCIISDCPLKKYMDNIQNGIDCPFLLNQFCEKLFKYGISKFPDDMKLKINYSIFLITDMNYKKKALIILNDIEKRTISLENNYFIYLSFRLLEKLDFSFENKNNSSFEYRQNSKEFTLLIKKLTLLYYDFLSLLLNSKFQNTDSFNKIHKIGLEILKNNTKIQDSYNKLISIQTYNNEIIKLYSEFVEGILCDKEKFEKCQNDSKLTYSTIIDIHERDFSNYDIEILKEKINLPYMIVSTHKGELGKIIDISMNTLKIFGYTKHELIGKHINILIPKLFHKIHNIIFVKENEKLKIKFFDKLNKKKLYYPDFIKKETYGITKMKFLIELILNIYFVRTEDNKFIYIIEIRNYNPIIIDLIKNVNSDLDYCVLTDQNFLIQTFTPNCLEFLKIDYSYINSNFSIINFIKEFQDDYLIEINKSWTSKFSINRSDIYSDENYSKKKSFKSNFNPNIKKKIKNDLFAKKYSKKCKITWKFCNNLNISVSQIKSNLNSKIISDYLNKNSNSNINSNINDNNLTKVQKDNNLEINIYMEIKKIIINQELLGYYFHFSKIKNKNLNNMSYILDNEEYKDNNNYSTKLKKYQCEFKSKEKETKILKPNVFNSLIVKPSEIKEKDKKEINKYRKKERKQSDKTKKVTFIDIEDNNPINNSSLSSINDIYDNNKQYSIGDNSMLITGDFIPTYSSHFLIDIKNLSFIEVTKTDDKKEYLDILKKEANDKIKIYQEQLQLSNNSEESIDESEEYETVEYLSEHSNVDSSNVNSSINESNDIKMKKTKNFLEISKKSAHEIISKKSKKSFQNNDENNIGINNMVSSKKIQKKNSLINNYYKVNLNNIHYMIYDFYKDMIVEGNKNEVVSKIETILTNSKNDNSNDLPKIIYSFFSIFNFINKTKKNIKEKKNKVAEINKKINEEKIFKNKIYEALNKKKDEPAIKKLKYFTLLSYSVMILYGILCIILDLQFLSSAKKALYSIKNTIIIKYCSQISVYYLREMTLLNFKVEEIKGGNYCNFASKDKDDYRNLIKDKIGELFIESQSSISFLYSSSISLSKNSTNFLSNYTLNLEISRIPKIVINYDILTALMQYSGSFYNLATTTSTIEQNHTDLFRYIYNNLNEYKKGLNILIDLFIQELQRILNIIIILVITVGLLIFIFFFVIYILVIVNFLSSIQTRGNYMKVFYGINENILKNLISNCEKLINKLKSSEDQRKNEDETLEDSVEDKKDIEENQKIQRNSINKSSNLNYSIENHNITSYIGIIFVILYGLFSLISYAFFIYNGIYMINTLKQSIIVSNFCQKMENYHLGIIEYFNIYREFIFDNQSIIYNMNSFDYLNKYEKEVLLEIYEDTIYLDLNSEILLSKNDSYTNKSLCNYYINDFFDSSVDCEETIGLISQYDFNSLVYNFFEDIKIKKNVIKYKLKNENILGNLTEYNYSEYINNLLIPRNSDTNSEGKALFRLDLFNNDTIHANLNIMFFSIILPYIEEHRKNIYNILTIDKAETYLIIITIVFGVIVTLIFISYFIPVINHINNEIYKTKNMLSIIPLDIILMQNGVSNLLKIKNDK